MRILNAFFVGFLSMVLSGSSFAHAETTCAEPTIRTAPRVGGLLQFDIQSPCRNGQFVVGRYGDLVIVEKIDEKGNLAFQVDCFQGDREIALKFEDNWRATMHGCAIIENTLTKVAIVWEGTIDLDLHAFEYAAALGSTYDRSASNPGSYQAAQVDYSRFGRSYGFMSTTSNGQKLGRQKVEVYTLLRHPTEERGVIAMGVGLGSDNHFAEQESCRYERHVDFNVYVLNGGPDPQIYERGFTGKPCDDTPLRIRTNLVPHIQLRGGRATGGASAR